MRRAKLASLAFVLAACGRRDLAPTPASTITIRDSGGVAIVDHPPGALAAAPRFRLGAPVVTIGGADADEQHDATFLTYAVLLDSSRFVTVHRRSWQLVLFDSTGTVLATFGRKGNGPGEFHDYPQPRRADDGLLIVMNHPPAVMRLGPDLLLRTDLRLPITDMAAQLLLPVRGGAVLAVSRAPILPNAASDPTQRSAEYLVRIDSAGRDTLATWQGMEWFPVLASEGGQSFVGYDQLQFGKSTVVEPWGNRLVIGSNDGWALEVRDTSGVLRRRIRLHEPAVPVTEAMKDSVRTRARAGADAWRGSDAGKANLIANIARIRFADSVAPYEDAVAAGDGSLWIAETVVPTENVRRYAVFDAAGMLSRRVEMPARYRLLAATGDEVLVRRLDQHGVGYLDLVHLIAVTP